MKPTTFLHSGKLGDIIYSLPALKAIGEANLYLRLSEEFSQKDFDSIEPLLSVQPYLRSVKVWEGEPIQVLLDEFRHFNRYWNNLADCHLRALALPVESRDAAWLELPEATVPNSASDVVFSRTPRYGGCEGFWERCWGLFHDRAVFVGTPGEHELFSREYGDVPFLVTKDLLELAQVLYGAKIFIGSQSCPLAIAEGLKRRMIQHTSLVNPNCLFLRPSFLSIRLPSELDTIQEWTGPFLKKWRQIDLSTETQGPEPAPESGAPLLPIVATGLTPDDDIRTLIRVCTQHGPTLAIVHQFGTSGKESRWDIVANEAESAGAEVVVFHAPDKPNLDRWIPHEMNRRGYKAYGTSPEASIATTGEKSFTCIVNVIE